MARLHLQVTNELQRDYSYYYIEKTAKTTQLFIMRWFPLTDTHFLFSHDVALDKVYGKPHSGWHHKTSNKIDNWSSSFN